MKNVLIVFLIVVAAVLSGCSDNSSSEMYKTAQFEELQNNKEHAVQLYEDIIKKYPESGHADKAKERLSELKKNR